MKRCESAICASAFGADSRSGIGGADLVTRNGGFETSLRRESLRMDDCRKGLWKLAVMRSPTTLFGAVALAVCVACTQGVDLGEKPISRIAFGSCLHQNRLAPIWEGVAATEPEVWIWLGDNVYADTDEAEVFAEVYGKVKSEPGYVKLRESARVLGTWDDHDFGKNNGGKEWTGKAVAQSALLDFLDEPANSPRRKQDGVYASYLLGSGEELVKLLLLDVRSHRDDPNDPEGDIFGVAQREWIERELSENEAALTVVASGTQVIPEEHRFEKWAQFPKAREWFFEQLVKYDTGAVLFLSGDRHISEFSKLEIEGREEPLYELTASSLTHAWKDFPGEPNRHRVGEVFSENNFGLLEINWEKREAKVSVRDERGETRRELVIGL
ncbi:hypothetical protein VDG1235_1702 [Verrucomicrobiia bacterium DG1235]|nr:hypothetical protein VDG1235_1702 [Verrucomicrobiae bacterium DG1235]